MPFATAKLCHPIDFGSCSGGFCQVANGDLDRLLFPPAPPQKKMLLISHVLSFNVRASGVAAPRSAVQMNAVEFHAKAAWLAKQEIPWWKPLTQDDLSQADPLSHFDVPVPMPAPSDNAEEAKAAWLAKLDTPKWGVKTEEAAKAGWLAKQEVPSWGHKVPAPALAPAMATTTVEDQAKAAWQAKQEPPQQPEKSMESAVMPTDGAPEAEAAAKAAWLAKQEVPFKDLWAPNW